MIAPACKHESPKKHGKDRNGNQRYKCPKCGATFTSNEERPLGDMRIEMDKAASILAMLLEGMSIRACQRLTGVKRDTICDLIVHVGENCDRYLEANVRSVEAKEIQLDEIWDFVACKNRTKVKDPSKGGEVGDVWTWLAIDAKSKMVLSHHVGDRSENACTEFLTRLNSATTGRCQVTSDGYSTYTYGVPMAMGSRVDFAQLIKSYTSSQSETRYSPATINGIELKVRFGNPDMSKISTSYSERLNLGLRMHVRRYTRLTNAHSKSFRHHAAMTSLFVAWYNFCRKNSALGKGTTPAMAAGVADCPWSIKTLLSLVA